MEVIDVKEHPKGGHVVTIQREKVSYDYTAHSNTPSRSEKLITEEWLRVRHLQWYLLPSLDKAPYGTDQEEAWKEYFVRQKYGPPLKTYKPKARGNPSKCMFCHSNMSGMSAQCLKCGGAMHLSCANESGGKCITPGCV